MGYRVLAFSLNSPRKELAKDGALRASHHCLWWGCSMSETKTPVLAAFHCGIVAESTWSGYDSGPRPTFPGNATPRHFIDVQDRDRVVSGRRSKRLPNSPILLYCSDRDGNILQ
jgi:hypothetical protein